MFELATQLIAENIKTNNPYLDLGNCGLKGTEEELYKPLRNTTHLETLTFSSEWWEYDKRINDFMPKYSQNTENSNQLEKIPDNLPPNLKRLLLAANTQGAYWAITDFSSIGNLKQLQVLDLSNNKVPDISFVKNLKNLESLDLWSSRVDNISDFIHLRKLLFLHLGNNQITNLDSLANFICIWQSTRGYCYFTTTQSFRKLMLRKQSDRRLFHSQTITSITMSKSE